MQYDYLIVGPCIIGMTIAYELERQDEYLKITTIKRSIKFSEDNK